MSKLIPLPTGFTLRSDRYHYSIRCVIGRGSNGYVYLADLYSIENNSFCYVALKEWASIDCCQRMEDMSISYQKNLRSEILINNFLDEYTVLSKINHRNVVPVYDWISVNGTYYYSMEYLSGGTLADCLTQFIYISEEQGILIIKQIAAGLEAYHNSGYIHNDLKMENIGIRSEDCVVIIDGGANGIDSWDGGGKQNMFLKDICALANILLCLLSGVSEMRPEYEKSESMFALAKEKRNVTYNTEKAIRLAFSARFGYIRDFISALDGHVETYSNDKERLQDLNRDNVTVVNDTQKAKDFLGQMIKTPSFFISRNPIDIKTIEEIIKEKSSLYGVQKINNWFYNLQKGFVLGLRLLTLEEFSQYVQSYSVKSGTYLTYDSHCIKFHKVEIKNNLLPWQKAEIKIEECDMVFFPENSKFYFASDLDPLIADSHRIHPFAKETQLNYDAILPASIFGFCKVSNRNRWGMVSNRDWVSMAIDCKYDRITDITYITIPGPGPLPPMFLGTICYVGEQIDVYELLEGSILRLKTSMTQADWNRRSRYS